MNAVENKEIKIVDICEINKENILNDAVFYWLFDMADEVTRFRTKNKLIEMATEYKCQTEFKGLYKAHEKEFNKLKKELSENNGNQKKNKGYTTHFDDRYPMLYSGVWVADENGICTYSENGTILACYHPVTIVNFFENVQTGEEKVRLAFKRNGRWKEITPNKDVIASNSKIVSLSNVGLSVTSETARALVRYLSDIEGLNGVGIPVKKSTTKLGWIDVDGKQQFIPFDDSVAFDGEEKFKNIFEAISTAGKADAWIEYVKSIRRKGRIEPRIMLAASFASVTVKICHALPFLLNLFGLSGCGKTVAELIAASVWGNPDKDSGLLGDFLTTPVAIEARSDLLNHLPLILDDTSKVSKRLQDDFSELIYTLCNGTGKDRSNQNLGLRRTNNWTNCILTTGEHPIVSDAAQGGAINRVIEVQVGDTNIFEDGHSTAEFFKNNYGHIGKMFIDAIKDIGFDEVRRIQRTFESILMEDEDRLQKQCISMSLILAADSIASAYIFKDGMELNVGDVVPYIKKSSDISEDEKCLEFIYGEIIKNQNRFRSHDNASPYPEVWGRIVEETNRVYIIKGIFDKLLKDAGYSPKAFTRWAETKGLIERSSDRYARKVKVIPEVGKTVWCVDLKWEDDLDGFSEID